MIKQLNKNNWRQWREIRLEALKKSPDSFVSSFEEEDKTPDNMWAEQLENSIKFGYFINDEIVGCLGLLIEKAAKISHTGSLFGIYVKDGVRGSGVGFDLVNFVKNYAKENHIKHLYLGCNAENRGAVKLYKKCGFKIYGTRPDYTKIDNKFYDDLTMMCEL